MNCAEDPPSVRVCMCVYAHACSSCLWCPRTRRERRIRNVDIHAQVNGAGAHPGSNLFRDPIETMVIQLGTENRLEALQ